MGEVSEKTAGEKASLHRDIGLVLFFIGIFLGSKPFDLSHLPFQLWTIFSALASLAFFFFFSGMLDVDILIYSKEKVPRKEYTKALIFLYFGALINVLCPLAFQLWIFFSHSGG